MSTEWLFFEHLYNYACVAHPIIFYGSHIYVTPRFKTCPVLKPAGSYVAITDPKPNPNPNPNLSPAESHH